MSRLLMIGGTRFMGYFATACGLKRGHSVTLFNRGKSSLNAFPQAERIRGDRDDALDLLRGRRWDVVIDTCGFVPRIVRKSAELLKDAVEQYIFISSCSVYSDTQTPGLDETGPLATLSDPNIEEVNGDTYGALKALCEQVVQETLPGRALIIRPGLIVGPRDASDRFDYWVRRVAQGGEALAPARPDYPVQFIDTRDLGEWLVHLGEARRTGVYNAVGPAQPFGALLDTCQSVSSSNATFTWVSEKFLLDHNVLPWQELPLWVTESDKAFNTVSNARALAAGLTFRPLADTVRASLEWQIANPERVQARSGPITREREQSLLREWHLQQDGAA